MSGNLSEREKAVARIDALNAELLIMWQALKDPELENKELLLAGYREAVAEMFSLLRQLRRLIKPK